MVAAPALLIASAIPRRTAPVCCAALRCAPGPDFVPFTETVFVKPAGLGPSTAWHQDPSSAWDEAWAEGPGEFDLNTCGFSFHVALSRCTAGNALWMVPGSHHLGRLDRRKLMELGGGSDRLRGAVPILCEAGDVYLQNRLPLHGAFPNLSDVTRVSVQFGSTGAPQCWGRSRRGTAVRCWSTLMSSSAIARR